MLDRVLQVSWSTESLLRRGSSVNLDGSFAPLTQGRTLGQKELPWCRVVKTTHSPNRVISAHAHRCSALTFVVKGEFQENVNRETYWCDTSTVLFKPAGSVHSNTYGPGGATSVIVEFFQPQHEPLRIGEPARSRDAFKLKSREIRSLAKALESELSRDESAESSSEVQSILLPFANQFFQQYLDRPATRAPAWLRDARDFILCHFASAITPTLVANHIGINSKHLSREMRRFFGKPVGQMIRDLRIQAASEQLHGTDATVTEIAYSLGFSDSAHFCRVFKHYYGESPVQFRSRLSI